MRFHIIALVVVFVGAIALLNYTTDDPVSLTNAVVTAEQDYDFFITDIDSSFFSPDGASQYRLKASRSTHYPDPDYTILDSPDLIVYSDDEAPWYISANSGRIEKDVVLDQDKVELSGNVRIHHIDSRGRDINIYTGFLSIYPNTKKINTELEVRIESPGAEIYGVGMTVDLVLNQVKLLADVRGRYYE